MQSAIQETHQRQDQQITLFMHDIQTAAQEVIERVHNYMDAHPESELHTCGKMFGVLIVREPNATADTYLRAFSAKLDGSYHHNGFVPPVYEMTQAPIGTSRTESQRLQRLLFANYCFTNGLGESRNLLDIFADEKPIISPEDWFGKPHSSLSADSLLPPSGAGECCAPKLLQYALTHDMRPIALAEFWIGAPSSGELRREGYFYPPCSGKCKPILRHMLKGVEGLTIEGVNERTATEDWSEKIEIIFEDEWLMVVNKPAGLLSVPGRTDDPSLVEILNRQQTHTFLQPAHRLDQDTGGLLVLAKSPDVYKTLQAYFQRRDILKRYEAIVKLCVNNNIPLAEGDINLPLLPDPYDRPRQMVSYEHGKVALTHYIVREKRANGTLLIDFYPHTGRTHQLRVHAAHFEGLNAPIVGDRLYGKRTDGERLMLHAAEIRFVHPITKEEMHFCIPSGF
ncbi:MAG: RluA family pseudouridine synthase [Paludibacteraceae bacterium]|nr:RluA family pseudouridine synthase [Paludibacteraceae bacterium]